MADLAGLGAAVQVCQDCPLSSMGRGVPGAFFKDNEPMSPRPSESGYILNQVIERVHAVDVMFIGEAPGPVEQEKGIPFVGTSGRLLHQLAKEAGLHDYYVSNVAKHFPGRHPTGKIKKPNEETVEACWPFLVKEIRLVRPRWIVLLGGTASIVLRRLKLVKGNPSMGSLVGRTFRFPYSEIQFLVLFHPAHFLYEGGARRTQSQLNEFRRCLMGIRGAEMPEWPWTTEPHGVIPTEADVVVDVETDVAGKKPDPRYDTITQVGLLPMDADKALLFLNGSGPQLQPLPGQRLIMHGGMYDHPALQRRGDHIPEVECTLAMAYSLGEQDLSLKGLGQEKLGVHTVSFKQAEKGDPNYLAQDVWLARRLKEYFKPLLRGTAYEIDRQLIPILSDMIFRGYEIDQDMVEQEAAWAKEVKARLEKVWYRTYPNVKISSPTKIAEALGLPNTDTKKTLRFLGTWEAEVLMEWRNRNTLLTRGIKALRKAEGGRLTGLFNLYPNEEGEDGTSTGRLSCRDENLQNLDPRMQRCLRAPKGMALVRPDYSQIELRCAGEVSEDEVLLDAYRRGLDMHQVTGDRIFGGDRARGKTFNFRELYITQDNVREAYPGFYAWAQRHWAEVQRTGYSVSPEPFLHRRFIPLLGGEHARRQAINHPIQSMAGYITKEAMVEVAKEYPEIVNQIHDSIHFFVPENEAGVAARRVEEIMVTVAERYLPRVGAAVDVKVGRYWD